MTKPKCRNCTFWVEGEQFGRNKTEDPDDRAGSCHRRAPHPTMGRWEYEVLQHLTLISWNTPNSKEKERRLQILGRLRTATLRMARNQSRQLVRRVQT